MTAYVLELKKITGNRVVNTDKLASVYFTNEKADVLAYCAPTDGL